jgi:hypothetical protein
MDAHSFLLFDTLLKKKRVENPPLADPPLADPPQRPCGTSSRLAGKPPVSHPDSEKEENRHQVTVADVIPVGRRGAPEDCGHETVSCEDGKRTCLQCGELLEENYIINSNYFGGVIGMKPRKLVESSVYKDIPAFIDRRIKELTVEIYNTVTKNKTFRNASKRAIVLASLHRAAALMGDDNAISFYDLLQMFGLQQHEANKGFSVLSSNISKDSVFFLKFDNDREDLISINCKIRQLGIEADARFFRLVANVFNLFKTRSRVAIESQYNSVICGCIYFWVVHLSLDKSVNAFVKQSGVSKATLLRVYCAVCDVVFNSILKELFSLLLENASPIPLEAPPRFKKVFAPTARPSSLLYCPEEKCIVFDPFDHTRVKVVIAETELPLDHVDDTLEWNILLGGCYFTPATKRVLSVTLFRRSERTMYFDFTDYDASNNTSGKDLLTALLVRRFDTQITRVIAAPTPKAY